MKKFLAISITLFIIFGTVLISFYVSKLIEHNALNNATYEERTKYDDKRQQKRGIFPEFRDLSFLDEFLEIELILLVAAIVFLILNFTVKEKIN